MNALFTKLIQFYRRIIHGVAFVPLLITLAFIALSVTFTSIETRYVDGGNLAEKFLKLIKVDEPATARAILASILTGILSLTVFSFSMMMVVVNQASSNFSPKVVETFINKRSNQYILGVYLGTIVFTLMALIQVDSEEITRKIPNISLIASIIFAIYSILLFVKFINNITSSVRITSIVERIYNTTKKSLDRDNNYSYLENTTYIYPWESYKANRSGYFQYIRIPNLLKILQKEDLVLKILVLPGYYFTKKSPIFSLNKKIEDEKVLEKIRNTFISFSGEDISENEYFGFRQLREVAVKALSPGINDPGVARLCIDYLGELLAIWLKRENKFVIADKKDNPRIILNLYNFSTLLKSCLTPIKAYGKNDYTILISLLKTLLNISYYDEKADKHQVITEQADSILEDADKYINNSLERSLINSSIEELNNCGYFNLKFLPVKTPPEKSDSF